MKLAHFLLAAIAFAASAGAATPPDTPRDFAYGLPIQADGRDALYRLELPGAVYRGVLRRDLGDLRVFNGAGEVVPHALYRRAASEAQKRAALALKFFPLYGDAAKAFAGLSLRVERNAAGGVIRLDERVGAPNGKQLLGYLLDASQLDVPLQALELEVKGEDYSAKVDLEASEDLANWRPLATQAPLLSLQYAGERIEQRRIEFKPLAPRQAKYLRLTWQTMPAEARLAAVRAEPGAAQVEAVRQWEAVAGQAGDKAGEYLFDAHGQFPVDRVRFALPQANTVAPLQLFARARAADPWRPLARTVAYRLRRDGGEIVSPEIALGENSDRYWRIEVDQKGGGLGAGEPKLMLGWRPHEVVWAARGEPPFTLAYGSRDARPSAYAIESLVPGYRGDLRGEVGSELRGAKPASLAPAPAVVPQATVSGAPATLGGASMLEERIDFKQWALWGSLLAGVGLLGWMAWRLWRQLDGPTKSGRPPGSGP